MLPYGFPTWSIDEAHSYINYNWVAAIMSFCSLETTSLKLNKLTALIQVHIIATMPGKDLRFLRGGQTHLV